MKTRLIAALASLTILAACQPMAQPAPPTSSPVNTQQTASGTLTMPENIVGEYRVAGVDGGEFDMPNAMTAAITGTRISVESGCIRFAWDYTLDGGTIATTPTPIAACRRALRPPEEAVRHAVDAANEVQRAPSNGIQFVGAGHTVTLFSQ